MGTFISTPGHQPITCKMKHMAGSSLNYTRKRATSAKNAVLLTSASQANAVEAKEAMVMIMILPVQNTGIQPRDTPSIHLRRIMLTCGNRLTPAP